MFLRSIDEKKGLNNVINSENLKFIRRDQIKENRYFSITFEHHDLSQVVWFGYETQEKRDQDYEWVLSQLSCKTNDWMEKHFAAPCEFCGYDKEDYYQKHTHDKSCPWYEIDGVDRVEHHKKLTMYTNQK